MASSDFALWLAWRIAQGIDAGVGEWILVRDQAGHDALLREVATALAEAGATPLIEIATPEWLARVLAHAPQEALVHFDQHRRIWLEQCHRIVTLDGGLLDAVQADEHRQALWLEAQVRLIAIEESRHVPHLVVAVPTPSKAAQLGMTLEVLTSTLLDAQRATLFDLERPMDRVLLKASEAQRLQVRFAEDDALYLMRATTQWQRNDGYIEAEDVAQHNTLATLPAGALSTSLAPETAHGVLTVPNVGKLHFAEGHVVQVESSELPAEMLLGAAPVALRLGLNPVLRQPLGWSWVDQLVHGAVTLDFGDHPLGEITLHGAALWLEDWQAFGA